jgi:serine/threonine protein kinase
MRLSTRKRKPGTTDGPPQAPSTPLPRTDGSTAVTAAPSAEAQEEGPAPPHDVLDVSLAGTSNLGVVGAGTSAVVYKAMDASGLFALKIWRQPLSTDERGRFAHQCALHRATAGHPNIVRFIDGAAPPDGPAWIATELCDESLDDRLRRTPHPSYSQACAWAGDILAGLAEIHRLGHVHRDVKPSNVLLIADRAVLCDLGIARPADCRTDNSGAGTPGFLAPELARGNQPTPASDVYSAANTLLVLFAPEMPQRLDNLLTRASSSHPRDRPENAAVFLGQLRSIVHAPDGPPAGQAGAGTPASATAPPVRERRWRRMAVRSSIALSALLSVIGLWTLVAVGPGALVPHTTTAPDTPGTLTGATSSRPLRDFIPTPSQGACLNRINAPREATTMHVDLTVQITCPVPRGEVIRVVGMVKGVVPGPVEFWIKDEWPVSVHASSIQHFTATVPKGVTQTFFLISANPRRLQDIEDQAGNIQPDGSGYRSLGGLAPVSNGAVNTQIPG